MGNRKSLLCIHYKLTNKLAKVNVILIKITNLDRPAFVACLRRSGYVQAGYHGGESEKARQTSSDACRELQGQTKGGFFGPDN
jgi:hypothetical protein